MSVREAILMAQQKQTQTTPALNLQNLTIKTRKDSIEPS
jgi:hypothetical protein